jgi:RNA polymerase sigma factor for flagellar operon FliA
LPDEWAPRKGDGIAALTVEPDVDTGQGDERTDALNIALADLPERWRRAVELYYYEGYEQHEVGKILGVNESRVSQILRAARERIERDLTTLDHRGDICRDRAGSTTTVLRAA